MKMKKALSIFLGGAVLVGSSSFIFANDALKLANEVHDQPAVRTEVSLESAETTETPTVTIEILDELINNQGEVVIDIDDEELEELIDKILDELEEANETEEEIDEDDELDEDEDNQNEENDELVLENLYRNLLKYQLVYDRVPAQAKPAIEKNMKNMQLKIVESMLKMNKDLETLIPEINIEEVQNEISNLKERLENVELTNEEKQELINSISELEMKIANYEEMASLVEFVNTNENWQKELKNKIHVEFKEEKAKVKAESKLAKEEIKQAREEAKEKANQAKKELQEQVKANRKADKNEETVETDQTIDTKTEIKVKNDDKKVNENAEKKSNSGKENNNGKGNEKSK